MAGQSKIPATLIPGDGIGPEIVVPVTRILDVMGAPFAWEVHDGGLIGIEKSGDPLPEATLESIRYFRPNGEPDVEVRQPGEDGWGITL